MDKHEIRQEVRSRLREISLGDRILRSRLLLHDIETMEVFQRSSNILLYWSLPDEVSTQEFVHNWCLYKNIYLPVMVRDRLELRLFESGQALMSDRRFGIGEPHAGKIGDERDIELVLVPARALGRDFTRVGRGKGYYDKLLPFLTNAYKIGIGFQEQLFDTVPVDEHDVLLDAIMIG